MTRRSLRRDMDRFADVYNSAWSQNWGFSPYSKEDLDYYAQELQLVFDAPWFMVAEKDGETVAVAITVPDINQVLRKMNGRLLPFGWWHFLRRRKIIDRCRVGFLGVKPEYQHTGVAAALYVEHFDLAERTPIKWGEMGWILETNRAMNRGHGGHERPQDQDLPGVPAHPGLATGLSRRRAPRVSSPRMEAENEPDGVEEVDAVPVLADEARTLQRRDAAGGVVVVKQAAAVAATSFAAGVVTVAAVRGARAVRARRRSRRRAHQLAPVLATRSFLIDVHLLGSRD